MPRDDDRLDPRGRRGRQLMPRDADLVYSYLRKHNRTGIDDLADGVGMNVQRVTSALRWLTTHKLAARDGYDYYAL